MSRKNSVIDYFRWRWCRKIIYRRIPLKENAIYDALAWDAESDDDDNIRRTECDTRGNKKFQPKYTILKGAISPVILFATLHKYSNSGEILVLDDCDSIFWDVDSLNILKAALDTGNRRTLTYSKDSHILKERGVPTKFDYHGSVIFITNLDFEAYCDNRPNSSIVPHLKALLSRTHYLSVGLHKPEERLIQIQYIQETSNFLGRYGCDKTDADEIIKFIADNIHQLREVSLRSAISIAEKRHISPEKWRQMVRVMEFKREFRK
ncbi:MAG: hypothetical protein HC836_40900 [Richelia sp. RM2_1_2]|nr:hypothetical protein [Richelia sp. RM2_1_2]